MRHNITVEYYPKLNTATLVISEGFMLIPGNPRPQPYRQLHADVRITGGFIIDPLGIHEITSVVSTRDFFLNWYDDILIALQDDIRWSARDFAQTFSIKDREFCRVVLGELAQQRILMRASNGLYKKCDNSIEKFKTCYHPTKGLLHTHTDTDVQDTHTDGIDTHTNTDNITDIRLNKPKKEDVYSDMIVPLEDVLGDKQKKKKVKKK